MTYEYALNQADSIQLIINGIAQELNSLQKILNVGPELPRKENGKPVKNYRTEAAAHRRLYNKAAGDLVTTTKRLAKWETELGFWQNCMECR